MVGSSTASTKDMNGWLKKVAAKKYKIKVDGRTVALTEEVIGELIKKKLRGLRVVHNAFKEFGVSIDQLDDLQILIKPLDGIFAETDARSMKISPHIVEDILTTDFFVVLHEICGHFTKRKAEEKSYFADPEERWGMQVGIAGMLELGYGFDELWNICWPKIGYHFHDERDGRDMMKSMFERAKHMVAE